MRKDLGTSSMLERRDVTSQANCSSGFDWMNNSLNPSQSPCLVAAYLRSPCTRDGNANVGALPPGSYQAPTTNSSNKCLCSWAEYNTISACAVCQNGKALTWNFYTTNCKNLLSKTYFPLDTRIPALTAIPAWAGTDPSSWSGGIFNVTEAQNITNEGQPDITEDNRNPPFDGTNHSNTKIIVGAVVGGVAFCLIVAGLWYFVVRKRRRRAFRGIRTDIEIRSMFSEGSDHSPAIDTSISPLPISALPTETLAVAGKNRGNLGEPRSSTDGTILSSTEMSSTPNFDRHTPEGTSGVLHSPERDMPPPTYTSIVSTSDVH
ncbi:uncharacterized protein FOMMEDRAFT_157976 [Fomitiporia mediterranea MF3/22]|uniref:uncharacterized protein n=1 Tax=Fomitiporia mediterranea (strain MF3/22) TaxID=694068 RepID=UPI0004407CF8|nr:uncharacterized protein FOMMEDRAFT_157976 [Fomitiporia mediterranea MF3/22]EJD00865.1 hypothetical protein FOMMEDRAFT_157976 [Fomitiporia mediterranea MF3/22]